MFENDDEEERLSVRKLNADCTARLISVLQTLRERDFNKMMGSGLMIAITDLEGRQPVGEFMIAAEDLEDIKKPIIASIGLHLERRLRLKQTEVVQLEDELRVYRAWANPPPAARASALPRTTATEDDV